MAIFPLLSDIFRLETVALSLNMCLDVTSESDQLFLTSVC